MYYIQSIKELKKIMDLEIVFPLFRTISNYHICFNNNSKPKEKIKNKQLLKPIDVTIFSIF